MQSRFSHARPAPAGVRLRDKVAIVTGIGNGIGKACALLFAAQGACVVGCDIDKDASLLTAQEARQRGFAIDTLAPCDLTQPAQTAQFVEYAVALHGGIDVVVNAAAYGVFAWIEAMDYETQWRKTMSSSPASVLRHCVS